MSLSDVTENYAVLLSEIGKELEKTEKQRLTPGIPEEKKIGLENKSVSLKKREREIIALIGKEIAIAIENSAGALKALSARIKVATSRMGRVTNAIDKSEKTIKKAAKVAATIPKK